MDSTVQKIERARQDLNEMGMNKGFQDLEVIEQSRLLDELIIQYYRISAESIKVRAVS